MAFSSGSIDEETEGRPDSSHSMSPKPPERWNVHTLFRSLERHYAADIARLDQKLWMGTGEKRGLSEVTGIPPIVLSAIFIGKCIDRDIAVSRAMQLRFCEIFRPQGLSWTLTDIGVGLECVRGLVLAMSLAPERFSSLSLKANLLKNEGIHTLGRVLTITTCALTSLDVSSNGIGCEGCISLAMALKSNHTLRFLDMSSDTVAGTRNNLGFGTQAFEDVLTSPTSVLAKLVLVATNASEGVCAFARGLKESRSLTHLDLSANDIGPVHFLAIARSLPDSTLRDLILRNNRIGDEGLKRATECWADKKQTLPLKVLDLSANDLTRAGAALLDTVYLCLERLVLNQNDFSQDVSLPVSESLTVFSTVHCKLSPATLVTLAERLSSRSLRQLVLKNNVIDPEAMMAIGLAVQTSTLRKLDLSSCCIRRGLQNLTDALRHNVSIDDQRASAYRIMTADNVNDAPTSPLFPPLQWMSLRDNAISADNGANLLAAMKINPNVLFFDVELCGLDFKTQCDFGDCCEQNRQRRTQELPKKYQQRINELTQYGAQAERMVEETERVESQNSEINERRNEMDDKLRGLKDVEAARKTKLQQQIAHIQDERRIAAKRVAEIEQQIEKVKEDEVRETLVISNKISEVQIAIDTQMKHVREHETKLQNMEEKSRMKRKYWKNEAATESNAVVPIGEAGH
eukprot:GEMP01016537.1.p1 GENE.GEMP01016537.1~~GEMP01016537.1.p1  ORF type:complete len:687 (+),score=161.87 GEMP01016537.1:282-2342(+)